MMDELLTSLERARWQTAFHTFGNNHAPLILSWHLPRLFPEPRAPVNLSKRWIKEHIADSMLDVPRTLFDPAMHLAHSAHEHDLSKEAA